MLRVIAIILLLYIAVRFLGKIFRSSIGKFDQQNQRHDHRQNHKDNRKEGDVSIEYTDQQKQKRREKQDRGDGDYIDFEELD